MVEFDFLVHDDDHEIKDKTFDTFAEAFDYAQSGLRTFIWARAYVDGVHDQDIIEDEIVWLWDDTWNREQAIGKAAEICAKMKDEHYISDETMNNEILEENNLSENVELEVKVSSDDENEIAEFARAILGDNIEFLTQDFDDPTKDVDYIPDAEVKIDAVPEIDVSEIEDNPIVEVKPIVDIAAESLEDTVEQDLADDRTPEQAVQNNLLDEPTDANEIRAHEKQVSLDESVGYGRRDQNLIPDESKDLLADCAVKDCEKYKIVAHCKEEKPVCNVERPLDKPLSGDPDLTSELYEEMSDKEFAEELEKKLANKKLNEELETFDIEGFEKEVTDSFEDDNVKGYTVIYTKDESPIVEVELWEDDSPVTVTYSYKSDHLFDKVYDNFESFADDLTYKYNRYLAEEVEYELDDEDEYSVEDVSDDIEDKLIADGYIKKSDGHKAYFTKKIGSVNSVIEKVGSNLKIYATVDENAEISSDADIEQIKNNLKAAINYSI